MKSWKYLLLFLPLALLGQVQPTGIYNSSVGISPEGDLWYQEGAAWSPLGNAYLFNRPMASVSNVAALVRAPAWSNTLAKVIGTLGYYDAGDGGGGMYALVPKTTTNWGRFASTNSAYMWQLLPDVGGIKIKQYGAKGDGVTDDTNPVKDWMKDIDKKSGIVNAGTYSISPIVTDANSVLNFRGAHRVAVAYPNPTTFLALGNCARFQRRSSPGLETASLFTVTANSSLNCYDIVFDGNKTVETAATTAYLYVINGGNTSELEGCIFINSAGPAVSVTGPGGNFSVLRNIRMWDVGKGIRLNQVNGPILNNVHIQFCRDNGIHVLGFSSYIRASTIAILDCAENGILIEGAQNNHFNDLIIQNTFKSGIMFSTTNGNNAVDNSFFQLNIKNANATSSPVLGTSPYGTGLYAAVSVTGNSSSDYAIRNRFDGCLFGDLTGGFPSRGKYNFEWLAPTGGSHYPWELWMFSNNQHTWNTGWLADFGPSLTNSVGEINVIHANNEFQSTFGKTGAINSAGWRIDIVEAGSTTTNRAALLGDVSHKLFRDTTGYGTPVNPTAFDEKLLSPPPEPRTTPIPDP